MLQQKLHSKLVENNQVNGFEVRCSELQPLGTNTDTTPLDQSIMPLGTNIYII